jgi:hypothetical protein
MLNFFLDIFSAVLNMNMHDPHEIPFALPLMMACFVGGTLGFIIVRSIGNENKAEKKANSVD